LNTGNIFDIRRFSIHDGPGIRTTIFFKGCPLACQWCHNPESQARLPELWFRTQYCIRCLACLDACDRGAISLNGDDPAFDLENCTLCGTCAAACATGARAVVGQEMSLGHVIAEVERDRIFYDETGGGATISGGEPLLQGSFLRALLSELREREIHTTLDTCGYSSWKTLDSLRQMVDLFLFDLKLIDDAKHRHYTGVSNGLILDNLQQLSAQGHGIILRLPVIPGITDSPDDLLQFGRFVSALPGRPPVEILPYHATGAVKYDRLGKSYLLSSLRPPSRDRVEEIAETLQKFGLAVKIGE
jgi:pyruvate formate lyase activating enzyme